MKEKTFKYNYSVNDMVVQIMGMTSIFIVLEPILELDVANMAIFLGNNNRDYWVVIYCVVIMRPFYHCISWGQVVGKYLQCKMGCIVITTRELQGVAIALLVAAGLLPPLPKLNTPQVHFTMFKAEGAYLGPVKFKELKTCTCK